MGRTLLPRVVRSGPYRPTQPRTGDDDGTIFRKNGMITRGRGPYYEQGYRGEFDLNENLDLVPLTGTLTLTADSGLINGVATLFKSELHLGQFILVIDPGVASYLLVVRRIVSDIQFEAWVGPDGTTWPDISGLTGYQMSVLFDVNGQRGTALRGNVPKLDKGSYIGVGQGTFRVNGLPLTGESLTLTRRPKIAVYDPLTDTYQVDELGLLEATPPTLAAVGGGVKGMQGASYSIVVSEARKETVGFGNPSLRADVTIATGDRVACTFAPLTTPGANARIVWVTTFADSLGADLNYLNGPWHRLRLIDDSEVPVGGGTINLEWLDAEVEFNELVSFNNDAPTDAEFVAILNNIPVWVSCQGQGYNLHPEATSPGPFIVPAKPNNIEAAPLSLAFSSSPPETIIGAVSAQGRIYLLTVAHLQIAQATPSDIVPIVIRPFWKAGFANPYQATFALGQLFGIPVSGPTRSAGDGDESLIEHDWAADVYEFTQHWNPGQAMIVVDPQNTMVVLVHSADHLNDAGFWTTRLLGYGLSQGFFIFDWTITSNTQDCIVSGLATIGDRLEFLVGGRRS